MKKPYRIIGAYDSETTNIHDVTGALAFPILHQIGILDIPIEQVTPDNVEQVADVHLFRRTYQACAFLDEIIEQTFDYVPVICSHNLSFDMYPLAEWLNHHHARVLAKSRQKPLTFTICDDSGNPRLVIWDTLQFSMQPLSTMGDACGFPKAVGDWDYNLIRTPETPLTDAEITYATHDIYALLCWLSWWLARNPDIKPERLGLNVVTKTGVVRERMRSRYDQVKGNGHKRNVGRYWHFHNKRELPKSDDELFTMHACTRGGFTFVASRFASVPFESDGSATVAGFDAVSMHPAQMASHRYPVTFEQASKSILDTDFRIVSKTDLEFVLNNWCKPFPFAFNACFRFVNLRPKAGSIFERFGIFPLASARFDSRPVELDEDNEQGQLFKEFLQSSGYKDSAVNPVFAFGKLESADVADVWITELEAWIICQCYDFDSVEALRGYETGRFARPTDMSILAVMNFYKAKNAMKAARAEYYQSGYICTSTAEELQRVNIAPIIIDGMRDGTISDSDLDSAYQATKADLNSLFGTQATNEFRQDTELCETGIEYVGDFGLDCAPKNPKAWYQFGQRIVGWSRIAQIVNMLLAAPYIETVVNGDTDSLKFVIQRDNMPALESALKRYADALDAAKADNLLRVKLGYPALYDPLKGIGHYECEFESDRFCASWNKAYCTYDVDKRDGQRHFRFTLAGIPARRGLDAFADALAVDGLSFGEICDLLLGYDVSIAYNLLRLNARSFPEWGSTFNDVLIDYNGISAHVIEPRALAIYPMTKTINSLSVAENRANFKRAKVNQPSVNSNPIICMWAEDGNPLVVRWQDGS